MYSKFKAWLLSITIALVILAPFGGLWALAAYIPVGASLTVGGFTFVDITNLIILHSYGTSNTKNTFRKPNASAGYTPSGSKTFRVRALKFIPNSTTASAVVGTLLYSDNDVGYNGSTAYTNPVYLGGDTSGIGFLLTQVANTPANVQENTVNFTMPNGKYLGFLQQTGANAGTVQAFGYEE